jgi:hypothetical protein
MIADLSTLSGLGLPGLGGAAHPLGSHVLAGPAVLTSSSSDGSGGGPIFVLIAALAIGIGFYWGFANYYRNANARFRFEERTTATVSDVRRRDERVNHLTGLRSSSMDGRNESDATAAVQLQVAWPAPQEHAVGPVDVPNAGAAGPASQPPSPPPPPVE